MYTIRWLRLEEHPGIGSLIIALIAAMAASATAGFIIERLAYRPLRKSPRINLLITAVGVSLFLQYSGQLVFGSDPQFFPTGILELEGYNWSYGDLVIEPMQIVALVLALILMFVLQYIIFRTRLGRAMRAVSFNHDFASLMGIPTNQIISATFMLGSALAGAAGVLVGLIYPKIDPLMGTMPGLKAFVAAVLGGIGNVTGAVLGAFTLGLAEEFLVGYWVPTYRDALAFGILILILLFKPSGLLGVHRAEKV
jgi:branched-chain amino acid transport system permease protein